MDPFLEKLLRLPQEMRDRDQWCVAAPTKEPWFFSDTLQYRADVTNPKSWMSFADAVRFAKRFNAQIGYVLNAADPFTCIDLDVKDASNAPTKPELWTTTERFDMFHKTIDKFASYAERSRSGKGFHIWIRGTVDSGMKQGDVEVYSTDRFIICTGNVVRDVGINERQELLTKFVEYFRGEKKKEDDALLTDGPEVEDDWSVALRIHNSAQREKFERLWTGNIDDYPSQSEADAALLQILCYYSENNTQVGRIFLASALGKRKKNYEHNYVYLRRSLARARTIRSKEKRAEEAAILKSQKLRMDLETGKAIDISAEVARMNAEHKEPNRTQVGVHAASAEIVNASLLSPAAEAAMGEITTPAVIHAGAHGLPWPPGIMGQIAQFIFKNSVRPAKEVAIVSAIGMMAGLCGKAWHIPQSGLNMYVVLIAKSAVGKEAMHTGISTIIKECMKKEYGFDQFHQFFDFTEYASGPALMKRVAEANSFCNVLGEWGKRLKRMAANESDGPLATLRTQMTNLYQKSGPQSVIAGIGYSDDQKNVKSTSGVAYSMIGETTPQTYYEALTPSMMEDGFLSRFLMIEYTGKRVPMNQTQELNPSRALCELVIGIARQAIKIYATGDNGSGSQLVKSDDHARKMIGDFEIECDNNINGTDDESRRQMWNRASLKSIRLAALLAVGDNCIDPVMTVEHVTWAQLVVRLDIANMTRRLDQGDVGVSDGSRERKVISVIREYLEREPSKSYKVDPKMRASGIIPKSYLHLRVSKFTTFINAREGAKNALDAALRTCVDNGYVMEVTKTALSDNFNYNGKAYRVLDLPDFDSIDRTVNND